jgi:tetratricopeptide (TPR) repeat protein
MNLILHSTNGLTMSDGKSLQDEGRNLYHSGQYEAAAAKLVEAQQAFVAANDQANAAECANDRGVCWRQAAKWDEATAAFTEARSMFQALSNVKGEGQVVGNMAALADSQNDKDRAAELYLEAIDLLEKAGAKDLAKDTYTALSRLRLKRRDFMGAIGAYDAGIDEIEKPSVMQRVVRKILGGSSKAKT